MTIARKIMARAKSIFAIAFTIVALSCRKPCGVRTECAGHAGCRATTPQQRRQGAGRQSETCCRNTAASCSTQKYGEVWVPTVTPQGWHPYPPCNWVNSKQYGWYYDDKTPWGQIVHHYGRWVSDAADGLDLDARFGVQPGLGCLAHVAGMGRLGADAARPGRAEDFGRRLQQCRLLDLRRNARSSRRAATAPSRPLSQVPVLLRQTTYVTDIRLVGGIIVIVLPSYVVGPIVIIDIDFGPWPTWFLSQMLIDWNFVWNNLVVRQRGRSELPAPCRVRSSAAPLPVNNPQPLPPPRRPSRWWRPPMIVR